MVKIARLPLPWGQRVDAFVHGNGAKAAGVERETSHSSGTTFLRDNGLRDNGRLAVVRSSP